MKLKRTSFFRLIKEPTETPVKMGRSSQYYLTIYDHYAGQKKWFPSWNWAGFLSALFGGELVWMVYRRMYLYAFFYFIFLFALTNLGFVALYFLNKNLSPEVKTFVLDKFADKDFLFFSLKMVLWLIKLPLILMFGVFGNALYFHFLETQAQKKYLPKTGVSLPAAGVILLIIVSLGLLNNYLLQTANTNLYSKLHDYVL
ncbi:MAG: hypothetical protein ACK5PQ_00365 [Alphaproteobacteria bacterium]